MQSPKEDPFGDRMKLYEQAEAGRRLMPRLPAMARLDGRAFHAFTKHAKRPFSELFHRAMVAVTRHLVEETGALVGYTQSDEIGLAWHAADPKSQMMFDGNIQKLTSTLAAMASVRLNKFGFALDVADRVKSGLAWHSSPTFDCRVWNAPTLTEAANVFVWRQADAVRNSVQMLARAHFSHTECQDRSCSALQEMLHARGVNWNDQPAWAKRGSFIQRFRSERRFDAAEIARLPDGHQARANPDLVVERTGVRELDMWVTRLSNREGALFAGEDPTPIADAPAST